MLYRVKVVRAVRPVNVPLLMAVVIWLLYNDKVVRRVRPVNAPL